MDEPADGTVTGVVDSIDQELARVLIGEGEDEWFFPVSTLPDGVVEGDVVGFVESEGRFVAAGFVGPRQTGNSIESRMSRGINKRRTTEIRRSELRSAIDEAKGTT